MTAGAFLVRAHMQRDRGQGEQGWNQIKGKIGHGRERYKIDIYHINCQFSGSCKYKMTKC
jgi:hypothetical protein